MVYLVISSNRGLCGGYNANLLRTATNEIKSADNATLEVVGKKASGYFKFTQMPVDAFHSHIGDKPEYVDVEQVGQDGQIGGSHVLGVTVDADRAVAHGRNLTELG